MLASPCIATPSMYNGTWWRSCLYIYIYMYIYIYIYIQCASRYPSSPSKDRSVDRCRSLGRTIARSVDRSADRSVADNEEQRIPRASDHLLKKYIAEIIHYKHLALRKIIILVAVGIFQKTKKRGKAFGHSHTTWILPKTSIVSNVFLVYVGTMIGSSGESKGNK